MNLDVRKIDFYETESGRVPVKQFLRKLDSKQVKKVFWVLDLVRELEVVPTQYLKKLINSDDIWEIRIQVGRNIFRLLCFFDGVSLIVLTSGFAKKSQKTPKQEIATAEQRKRDYFHRKQEKNDEFDDEF